MLGNSLTQDASSCAWLVQRKREKGCRCRCSGLQQKPHVSAGQEREEAVKGKGDVRCEKEEPLPRRSPCFAAAAAALLTLSHVSPHSTVLRGDVDGATSSASRSPIRLSSSSQSSQILFRYFRVIGIFRQNLLGETHEISFKESPSISSVKAAFFGVLNSG